MIVRPMMMFGHGQGQASDKPNGPVNTERSLTLLIEGIVQRVPELDAEANRSLRSTLSALALRAPDRLNGKEKFEIVQEVIHEFDIYLKASNAAARAQALEWRAIVELLFRQLILGLGIDLGSSVAAPLLQSIGRLTSLPELRDFHASLDHFLHPGDGSALDYASPLRIADRSSANDNASGLMGGGAAVERLSQFLARGTRGFVVVFRLACLDVISERFGTEAVEDCLMAISNYLTECLRNEDAVYHWSDSSLLAILQARANENILSIELRRIASNHRDIAIQLNDRSVMLRVPLEFDITPISRLKSAEDLYRLTPDAAIAR